MPPDRLIRNGFRFLALLLPPVAALAFKGLVPLLCVAALPILAGAWRQSWRPRPRPVPTALLGALLLWCAVASLWSYDAGQGLFTLLRNGTLIALGVLLWDILDRDATRPEADAVIPWIVGGCALGAAVILLEIASDHILFRTVTGYAGAVVPHGDSRLNRGAMALALLVFFTLPYGRRRDWRIATATAGGAGLAIALSLSGAAQTGVVVGILVLILVHLRPNALRRVVGPALAVLVLAMPVLAKLPKAVGGTLLAGMPESTRHRVQIWDFTTNRILERPFFGWGYGSSRDIPNFGVTPLNPDFESVIPMHPHNGILEIWLELGVVGAAIVFVLLLWLARRLAEVPAALAPVAYAVGLTAIWIAVTAYGLWQEHWIAALVALAGFVKIAASQMPGRPRAAG